MRRGSRLLAVLVAVAIAGAVPAHAAAYSVYCANDRIEVDSRTLEQMISARGSRVCTFGGFNYLSDAERHATQFGGKGAKCSCGR